MIRDNGKYLGYEIPCNICKNRDECKNITKWYGVLDLDCYEPEEENRYGYYDQWDDVPNGWEK